MQKVRVAIIGTGGVSRFHAEGLKANLENAECVALCDASPENLKLRSEQLGGVRHQYTDWKEMFAEVGDEIDAVDICLPHHLHYSAIMDAIAAGKHVLCEKPMCIDLDEANEIVEAVRASGLVYMSAHNQLFFPAVQQARKLLDEGAIGELRWVRSQDCTARTGQMGGSWRSQLELQGGGALIDTGYHPAYRLLYFAGARMESVRGTFGRFSQRIDGEDTASVQVRFQNGVIGEVLTSWAMAAPYGSHQIHLIGSKGQIFGSNEILYYLPAGFVEPAAIEVKAKAPFTSAFAQSFALQWAHFIDCIRTGRPPIHGPEEGFETLRMIRLAADDAEGWQKSSPVKVHRNPVGLRLASAI